MNSTDHCRALAGAVAVLATALFVGMPASRAQEAVAPNYQEPMGIGLEAVAYPYPVRFFDISARGRQERLAYMDIAPSVRTANAQTVVLLHGKNFWGAYWQETINLLSKSGYRVVVPDLLGFGKSSKPDDDPNAYTWDLQAGRVRQLLKSLGIVRYAVVGHSMGGMVSIVLAANNPQVTRLVLEDPIGLEDYRKKVPSRTIPQLIADEYKQTPEQIRAYRKSYFVHWLPAYERFVEVPSRIRFSGEFGRWARVSAYTSFQIQEQPVLTRLPEITCPTLLVVGEKDRTAPGKDRTTPQVRETLGNYPALGRATVQKLPQGRLVVLPNCGHIPHIEAEQPFHDALLGFLQESGSAR